MKKRNSKENNFFILPSKLKVYAIWHLNING